MNTYKGGWWRTFTCIVLAVDWPLCGDSHLPVADNRDRAGCSSSARLHHDVPQRWVTGPSCTEWQACFHCHPAVSTKIQCLMCKYRFDLDCVHLQMKKSPLCFLFVFYYQQRLYYTVHYVLFRRSNTENPVTSVSIVAPPTLVQIQYSVSNVYWDTSVWEGIKDLCVCLEKQVFFVIACLCFVCVPLWA